MPCSLRGIKGPNGDNYLYGHLQTDAQVNYNLPKVFTAYVSGLNQNNEVFDFYNGSGQYVVQREYYKPTYSFGVRWNVNRERRFEAALNSGCTRPPYQSLFTQ